MLGVIVVIFSGINDSLPNINLSISLFLLYIWVTLSSIVKKRLSSISMSLSLLDFNGTYSDTPLSLLTCVDIIFNISPVGMCAVMYAPLVK